MHIWRQYHGEEQTLLEMENAALSPCHRADFQRLKRQITCWSRMSVAKSTVLSEIKT
jgi:hypothetical protein